MFIIISKCYILYCLPLANLVNGTYYDNRYNAPSSPVLGKGLIGVSDIGLFGLIQGQFFALANIVNPVRI